MSNIMPILFRDDVIVIIREGNVYDSFVPWLHILVLMDNMVLLSPPQNGMLRTLTQLQNDCTYYGMAVSQSKTKFFVIIDSESSSRKTWKLTRHCPLTICIRQNIILYKRAPLTIFHSVYGEWTFRDLQDREVE